MERADRNVPMKRQWGFTLLELLVVMMIMAMLAGFVLAALQYFLVRGKKMKTVVDNVAIKNAIEHYYTEYERWPFPDAYVVSNVAQFDTTNVVVMSRLSMTGNLHRVNFIDMMSNRVADCWARGHRVRVTFSNDPPVIDVLSSGPDKIFGTGDDIVNNIP